eukprot:g6078.t1
MEEESQSIEEPTDEKKSSVEVKRDIPESSGAGPSATEDRPTDEDIIQQQNQLRMKDHMETCKKKLLDAGFQELVFEDALAILQQRVEQIGTELTLEEWELVMNDDNMSNYIVMFLRLLTSAEIQLRREFFEPFIMGISDVLDVELFCQRMVEVMDEESDEIHIRALTDALEIPTRVYSLDSQPPIEIQPTDYVPEEASIKSEIIVHLLYRPGHYDIIYPKTTSTL